MRCWLCDAEPVRLLEITTLGEREPRYMPLWPRSDDHAHADRPPTPSELEQAGHEALMRIRGDALRP